MFTLTLICVKIAIFAELANGSQIVIENYNSINTDQSHHHINKTANSDIPHWQYGDSSNWNRIYASCGGNYQSPINIDPAHVLVENYPQLIFGNYNYILWSMRITNNGHTVLLDLPANYPAEKLPFIKGGGLSDQFNFVQLHFHWGGDSGRGSEHLIQNKQYAGEVHVVHYNSKYGSFAEASKYEDGIAVLGIFMEIGWKDNTVLSLIVDQFGEITKTGQQEKLHTPIILQYILPYKNVQNFYRYTGSLTTPGCQEIVSWTIFETPIIVSEYQLEQFRELLDENGHRIQDNFRTVQNDRGRVITYSSDSKRQHRPFDQYISTVSPVQLFQIGVSDMNEGFLNFHPLNYFYKLQRLSVVSPWVFK